MNKNSQGGSTPDTITVNGRTYTDALSFESLSHIWRVVWRMFQRSLPSADADLVARLNADAKRHLYTIESAIDDGLTWLGGVAFEMGVMLEDNNG